VASKWDPPFWIGDRLFSPADIELIRWTTDRFGKLSRTELANTMCENLPLKAPKVRKMDPSQYTSSWVPTSIGKIFFSMMRKSRVIR
jgi:hypothetical protein